MKTKNEKPKTTPKEERPAVARKRKTSPIFGRCNEHDADDCFWCFPGL